MDLYRHLLGEQVLVHRRHRLPTRPFHGRRRARGAWPTVLRRRWVALSQPGTVTETLPLRFASLMSLLSGSLLGESS